MTSHKITFLKGSYQDGLHGFINLDGKIIIQAKYKSVIRYGPDIAGRMIGFQYGLCAVQVENGKWGYIDKNDRFIIDPVFDKAEPFFSKYARVEYNKSDYFLSIEKIKKENDF